MTFPFCIGGFCLCSWLTGPDREEEDCFQQVHQLPEEEGAGGEAEGEGSGAR